MTGSAYRPTKKEVNAVPRQLRIFLCLLPVLLILYLCFFPVPIRIRKNFDAHRYSADAPDEPAACAVSLDGVYRLFLFRANTYEGVCEISGVPETSAENAHLRTPVIGDGGYGYLWYQTKTDLVDLGMWVAPGDLSWLYLRLDYANGTFDEIIAPSSGADWSAMADKVARTLNQPVRAAG